MPRTTSECYFDKALLWEERLQVMNTFTLRRLCERERDAALEKAVYFDNKYGRREA